MIEVVLSDALKELFEEHFLHPANTLFAISKIGDPTNYKPYSPEAIAIKNAHRKTIIDFGRSNFKKKTNGLTPAQQVDLYCYYYFQLHFSSSYAFYAQESEFLKSFINNKPVLFMDIGCGPFTSGLAFNQWTNNFDILNSNRHSLYCYDTSKAMIEKAASVAQKIPNDNYRGGRLNWKINEESKLGFNPKEFINEYVVILNFSYLFGSETVNVNDMVTYTNDLVHQFCNNERNNRQLIILQQNPDYESLNKKWWEYKSQLKEFTSLPGYPQTIEFCFEDALGSFGVRDPYSNVRCDVLKLI